MQYVNIGTLEQGEAYGTPWIPAQFFSELKTNLKISVVIKKNSSYFYH